MTELEKLEDYAYGCNIDIFDDYYISDAKGSCFISEDGKAIVINKRVVDGHADVLCTLAEEIGHIETESMLPVSDYLYPDYKKWLKRKNEIKACRWAINRLVPPEIIQSALDDCCCNDYEIAEYCNVTIDFLHNAVEYYKRKGIVFNSSRD